MPRMIEIADIPVGLMEMVTDQIIGRVPIFPIVL